jgi:hypothetical protein
MCPLGRQRPEGKSQRALAALNDDHVDHVIMLLGGDSQLLC